MNAKERLNIAKIIMEDEELIKGGINEALEKEILEKYDISKEELENIFVAIHAIAQNRKILQID